MLYNVTYYLLLTGLCFLTFCNDVTEALDDDADFDVPVDIFAIGFEEIVDLNAGNIVSARFAVCLTFLLY